MQGAMPISMATVGTVYTIKKISGNTEVRSHLKSMGRRRDYSCKGVQSGYK